jgi:sulfur carrier protein
MINGKETELPETTRYVIEVLDLLNINSKRVSVEFNEEIIAHEIFEKTTVQDKDCIEIVSFVGGG